MAMKRSAVWADVQGRTRRTDLLGSASLAGVQAALAAKSNAGVVEYWEGADIAAAPSASGAAYASVSDVAGLLYADASGSIVRVTLPAPSAGIFMPDGETVDQAQIAAITAAVIAVVLTANGSPLTHYVGGTRLKG